MSATTAAWLVLALPLAGMLIISLGWRLLPGRTAGWIGNSLKYIASHKNRTASLATVRLQIYTQLIGCANLFWSMENGQ